MLALLASSWATADPDFSGFWQTHCGLAFGLSIERLEDAGSESYAVNFCGPGSCSQTGQYRPVSPIVGDSAYRVVNPHHLVLTGSGRDQRYFRCDRNPRPALTYQTEQAPLPSAADLCEAPTLQAISGDHLTTIPALSAPLVYWTSGKTRLWFSASDLIDLLEQASWPTAWRAPETMRGLIEHALAEDGDLRAALNALVGEDEMTRLNDDLDFELPLTYQTEALARTLAGYLISRGVFSLSAKGSAMKFWKLRFSGEPEDGMEPGTLLFSDGSSVFWRDCWWEPGADVSDDGLGFQEDAPASSSASGRG